MLPKSALLKTIMGSILLFIAAFGYIALTDEFMGYLYGHNNLWELIEHYLIMFVDEG